MRHATRLILFLTLILAISFECSCSSNPGMENAQDPEIEPAFYLDSRIGYYYFFAPNDGGQRPSIEVKTDRVSAAGYGTAMAVEILPNLDRVYFFHGARVEVTSEIDPNNDQTIDELFYYVEADDVGNLTEPRQIGFNDPYRAILEGLLDRARGDGIVDRD